MQGPLDAFAQMLLAMAILAIASGLPAFVLYRRSRNQPLPPPLISWPVPCNGVVVFLGFLAFIIIAQMVVPAVLGDSGFFPMLYGSDFPSKTLPGDMNHPERAQAAHLRGLWSQTIAIPIVIALILVGMNRGTRASLPQMGLSRERIKPNLVLGYVAWLVLTPLAFAAYILAIATVAPAPDKHPLMDLGRFAGRRELLIFAIQAAIFAPAIEELLFRGLLLPWLAKPMSFEQPESNTIVPSQYRPHFIFAIALLLSYVSWIATPGRSALPATVIFLIALLPFHVLLSPSARLRRRLSLSSPHEMRALFASSALFAAIHSNVWPSPVPLFVLGLGLGWLALRTRSIVPSIVVHALFNAIAVVYMLIGGRS